MARKVRILIEPYIVHPSAAPAHNVAVREEGDVEAVIVVRELEPLELAVVRHCGQHPEHRCPTNFGVGFL